MVPLVFGDLPDGGVAQVAVGFALRDREQLGLGPGIAALAKVTDDRLFQSEINVAVTEPAATAAETATETAPASEARANQRGA